MSKRISGPPRRPRNPIARAVRTPQYRQRVQPERRRKPALPGRQDLDVALEDGQQLPEEDEGKTAEKSREVGPQAYNPSRCMHARPRTTKKPA